MKVMFLLHHFIFGTSTLSTLSEYSLIETRCCQALFLETPQSLDSTFSSPLELAAEISRHMKPDRLSVPPKKPGKDQGSPPEDRYGREFYRASGSILGGGAVLWSSQYAHGGVKNGPSLDFYLASQKWGLEFTREDDQLRSHCERFQPGGSYYPWIANSHLLDWAIIDFRSTPVTVSHPGKC